MSIFFSFFFQMALPTQKKSDSPGPHHCSVLFLMQSTSPAEKKNVIHSAEEDKNNLEAGASYDAAETSQLLISSVLGGLALVKSGLKGTKATMQAHRKTPKICKYFCIHACPVLKLTYRDCQTVNGSTQLHYHDCQTLIFNKITSSFFNQCFKSFDNTALFL